MHADGWLLRSTPTVPRGRLNSALPVRADPDLAPVDAFYAARGQPAQVQVTPLGGHPRLEAELARRGWTPRWPTAVLTADARAVASDAAGCASDGVVVLDAPTSAWLGAWSACEERPRADVDAHAATVLAPLAGRAGYAIAAGGDAMGIGVCDAGLCGLFSIAARPERRRAGLGTAVVRALAAWAAARAARELYLEVEERNAPALGLYARLGFARAYRYVHLRSSA